MSDVSKSLRSLPKMSDHERIAQVAHFFAKNERFARKPMSKFPALYRNQQTLGHWTEDIEERREGERGTGTSELIEGRYC